MIFPYSLKFMSKNFMRTKFFVLPYTKRVGVCRCFLDARFCFKLILTSKVLFKCREGRGFEFCVIEAFILQFYIIKSFDHKFNVRKLHLNLIVSKIIISPASSIEML